ncbi:RNA polymerase sigma factor [Planctomicrobium sp. SH661]|uniref:RNA polymerase sigma factor n=1 Tax=Planctomicrobium sp. SH661 TaxID=3448124 RepID=UPI003F5C27B3
MAPLTQEQELVRRIRARDEGAWQTCIQEYSGRLRAFALSRLGDPTTADDVVQETFLGFLTALPNFDEATPLETFLFAIASHKITDVLRRQGRRPALSLNIPDSNGDHADLPARGRMASSLARSRELRDQQAETVTACLRTLIQQWFVKGEFARLKCAELLFVQGLTNKETAARLGIDEQDVANHKQFVVSRLKLAAPDAPVSPEFER